MKAEPQSKKVLSEIRKLLAGYMDNGQVTDDEYFARIIYLDQQHRWFLLRERIERTKATPPVS